MTDKERIDWLENHWDFSSKWDYQRGFILKRNEAVSGEGKTFREAVDNLIRSHDRVMNQRW